MHSKVETITTITLLAKFVFNSADQIAAPVIKIIIKSSFGVLELYGAGRTFRPSHVAHGVGCGAINCIMDENESENPIKQEN